MGRLANRNCIVTGAARGIGLGIADGLLREGANVAYADMDGDITAVAAQGKDRGGTAGGGRTIGLKVDVTDRKQVHAAIKATVAAFGSVDVVFNNAGLNTPMNFLDVTEDNWNMIMRVNALGVLIGMQEAAKQMIAQGTGGKIINTASIAGRQGYDNIAPYCASKFAVVSLTQSGARALAAHNITVNGFAPGVVATPLWEQLDKDLMALGVSKRPARRWRTLLRAFSGAALETRGYRRNHHLPGIAELRLHDRPNHHDRRRNGAGLVGRSGRTEPVLCARGSAPCRFGLTRPHLGRRFAMEAQWLIV